MYNLSAEEIEQLLKDLEIHNPPEHQLELDFSKVQDHNEIIECPHEFIKKDGFREVYEFCTKCHETKK